MESKLPPSEKTFNRVFQDVSTATGADFETTARALQLIFFHVYSNAKILRRLRADLTSAGAGPKHSLDLKTLEQLPSLTAILMEGLRLSPAIATQMARVSPSRDIFYNQWRVSAGTGIGMTLVLMQTDESLYPEPKQFNPDRWMHAGALKKIDKGFAPFSKGTRDCLGRW